MCNGPLIYRHRLISCLEIYNDYVYDLLTTSGRKMKSSVSCTQEIVNSSGHVLKIIEAANERKKMAATEKNKSSSRSHTIFKMSIQSNEPAGDTCSSELNFVDLAGFEQPSESHFQESVSINKSLSQL